MDKKIYEEVNKRADGFCEICGEWQDDRLQLHHIVGGNGKRQECETAGSCIMLCRECHEKAHNDYKFTIALRKMVQASYSAEGIEETKLRDLMGGKLY